MWQYILQEGIPIVPLYFAKERPVVRRGTDLIVVDDERMRLLPNERPEMLKVRFRTLGCYPVTGATLSEAEKLEDIVFEMLNTRCSERQGRAVDREEAAAMERKKKDGYF